MELQEILEGSCFDAYEYFGAHPMGDGSWVFRVYAPHARRVTLEGDFNGWWEAEPSAQAGGVYEFRVPWAMEGQKYKYCVTSSRGVMTEKEDPFAFGTEVPPKNASVLRDPSRFVFHDEAWMAARSTGETKPVNIYELHALSWDRRKAGAWRDLARELIPWLQRFGYTHVELLPITEHPMEGSWGYQVSGFFAPTARLGAPESFSNFVDTMHRAGIGVIVDFVCVHFASDQVALRMFDGSALFESPHPSQRRSDWGSILFDHGSGFVRSFLQSAADHWLTRYHIDGLRFDAVSYLIYNGGREDRGENLYGIRFLEDINRGLRERHPSVMLMAEDSTLYQNTTRPVDTWGGLGFHYKWDMGWTHDALAYMRMAPSRRPGQSRLLTLGIDHFDQARWMLPFSHDDASHGFLPALMPGSQEDKLAQTRLFLLFMAVHPGKKLMFMGTETGMADRWHVSRSPDRNLDEHDLWLGFSFFTEDLFRLYRDTSALWEADLQSWGAEWISADEGGSCMYALLRHSAGDHVLAVMNFSGGFREQSFPLPGTSGLALLLHSDRIEYSGRTRDEASCARLQDGNCQVRLEKFSGAILRVFY